VFVNAPKLMHLVQDMLIERVEFVQGASGGLGGSNASGTTAKLTWSIRAPTGGDGQSGKESDQAWYGGMADTAFG